MQLLKFANFLNNNVKKQIRRVKLTKVVIILSISVGLGFVLWFLAAVKILPIQMEGLIIGIIFIINIVLVFSLMAYFLDFERLYIYAILYAIPFSVDFILNSSGIIIPLSFICSGIIIAIGIVLLIKFLKKYPISDGDKPIDE